MKQENLKLSKTLKDLHIETLNWKSIQHFIEDEIQFSKQLLNSYVFEPDTPNLFERLQVFKDEFADVRKKIDMLKESIQKHENNMGGMLECDDLISSDHVYYQEHEKLEQRFNSFHKDFRDLKSRVFLYASDILKRNKKDNDLNF
ncbi:hypothetical protein [Aquimarina algicola]|uniref:Uncharacterized protein n=1 Tax=Aquimarina algicola TaxID=2589995 RepID=A0A504J977_9FLAO|nr:hypothetical protein [Aquimarina algicola]TPN87466.1 hypothetical protein FHK87_07745 [Aquimarina algicola]